MKPTITQALQACDGTTVDAAIKRLVAECGEDREVCRDVVGGLLTMKLTEFTLDLKRSESVSNLTDAGRHYLATHSSRKVVYNALDDILSQIEGTP